MPKFFEGYAAQLTVPAGKRDVQVFDDDLPGFGIRKFDSGRASYFVKYNVGAQQRRLTLGAVVRGNLADMRKKASAILSKARLGQDAVAEKRAASIRSATLGELVPLYLKQREGDTRPRYHKEITRHLQADWKSLHSTGVNAIGHPDVVSSVDGFEKDQGKSAADHARIALSGFYGWAIEKSHATANPTLNVSPRAPKRQRERVLSPSELVEIWNACLDDDYGTIVRLLMLTGQRRDEIGRLADSEIDADGMYGRVISLPGERTKNRLPHLVPLSVRPVWSEVELESEKEPAVSRLAVPTQAGQPTTALMVEGVADRVGVDPGDGGGLYLRLYEAASPLKNLFPQRERLAYLPLGRGSAGQTVTGLLSGPERSARPSCRSSRLSYASRSSRSGGHSK